MQPLLFPFFRLFIQFLYIPRKFLDVVRSILAANKLRLYICHAALDRFLSGNGDPCGVRRH